MSVSKSALLSCYRAGRLTRILFQALVYRDGNLVSGSLEALVQHMVPTEEYYPDRAYLFAFLLSARLFIKPHELLGEVCALCEHQQNLNGEGGKVSTGILLICSTKPFTDTMHPRRPRVLSFHQGVMHPSSGRILSLPPHLPSTTKSKCSKKFHGPYLAAYTWANWSSYDEASSLLKFASPLHHVLVEMFVEMFLHNIKNNV